MKRPRGSPKRVQTHRKRLDGRRILAAFPPGGEFERLFHRSYRQVFSFFARRGLSSADCADLTQETFLRVYTGMASFRREAALETFLFHVATNVWNNEVRSQSTQKRNAEVLSIHGARGQSGDREWDLPVDPGAAPDEQAIAKERRERLHQAIDELPARMQECILLRVVQGLNTREIADALKISKGTVKSQISQAKEKLKKMLGDTYGTIDL